MVNAVGGYFIFYRYISIPWLNYVYFYQENVFGCQVDTRLCNGDN